MTKAFGGAKSFRAVDRLSFTVRRGAIYGFIGPNGAGKTTTLRMVATLLEPDAGEITVAGHNTIDYPREVRRAVGYMPDDVGMYDGWTEHELHVTPSFGGIDLRITGRDRNETKGYLYDVYAIALQAEIV